MGKITEILGVAQQRAEELDLPYAGAVTPQEAAELLQLAPGAKLVDVRTRAELDWVGRIPEAVEIEWQAYPTMKPNAYFIAQLQQQVEKEALVLFICRSGHRSHHAAILATTSGYTNSFNVLEGFEGSLDEAGRRGKVNGWQQAGLPWSQT